MPLIGSVIDAVRARPGRLSTHSVSHSKSSLYGEFVWARRVLNSQKRRFSARAVRPEALCAGRHRGGHRDVPAARAAAEHGHLSALAAPPRVLAARIGMNPIATLEKRLLNMIGTWYKVVELYCEVTNEYNP
jgi:hypothetical protein